MNSGETHGSRFTFDKTTILYGIVAGLLFGALFGYWNKNLIAGIAGGVFFTMGITIYLAMLANPIELQRFSPAERKEAARIVRKGEANSDPELAPAVLATAQRIIRLRTKKQYRWVFAVGILLGLVVGGAGIGTESNSQLFLGVRLVILFTGMLLIAEIATRREIKRATHAEKAAAEVTATSQTPT